LDTQKEVILGGSLRGKEGRDAVAADGTAPQRKGNENAAHDPEGKGATQKGRWDIYWGEGGQSKSNREVIGKKGKNREARGSRGGNRASSALIVLFTFKGEGRMAATKQKTSGKESSRSEKGYRERRRGRKLWLMKPREERCNGGTKFAWEKNRERGFRKRENP